MQMKVLQRQGQQMQMQASLNGQQLAAALCSTTKSLAYVVSLFGDVLQKELA